MLCLSIGKMSDCSFVDVISKYCEEMDVAESATAAASAVLVSHPSEDENGGRSPVNERGKEKEVVPTTPPEEKVPPCGARAAPRVRCPLTLRNWKSCDVGSLRLS